MALSMVVRTIRNVSLQQNRCYNYSYYEINICTNSKFIINKCFRSK